MKFYMATGIIVMPDGKHEIDATCMWSQSYEHAYGTFAARIERNNPDNLSFKIKLVDYTDVAANRPISIRSDQ